MGKPKGILSELLQVLSQSSLATNMLSTAAGRLCFACIYLSCIGSVTSSNVGQCNNGTCEEREDSVLLQHKSRDIDIAWEGPWKNGPNSAPAQPKRTKGDCSNARKNPDEVKGTCPGNYGDWKPNWDFHTDGAQEEDKDCSDPSFACQRCNDKWGCVGFTWSREMNTCWYKWGKIIDTHSCTGVTAVMDQSNEGWNCGANRWVNGQDVQTDGGQHEGEYEAVDPKICCQKCRALNCNVFVYKEGKCWFKYGNIVGSRDDPKADSVELF